METYIKDLKFSVGDKNLDILELLGVDTSNLKPNSKDPFCIENDKNTWMYDFKEFTGDIQPNIEAGAILTPQMEQYNRKKLAESGIEI